MDDPQGIPDATPPGEALETRAASDPAAGIEQGAQLALPIAPVWTAPAATPHSVEDLASQRRDFRRNLAFLLSFSLAAFILTSWILVRVDLPFGSFSTGPQDIARAQLRALDRGELRPAYDMFSERYRQQVSFDVWHELVVTHWRMFHAEVLEASAPTQSGPRATLEILLRGADENEYRARYTMVRVNGRWWIDDVHWSEEATGRNVLRA